MAENYSDKDKHEDVKILHGMGYAQELSRSMSKFSNFAISFSIICILSGGINSFAQAIGSVGGAGAGMSTETSGGRDAPIHPRLLAMMSAARYYGLELDPSEFRLAAGETEASAPALSAWAQAAGMWSRALRLRWRHLMQFSNTGPVILLFTDGTAGLLVGANAEAKVVALRDPHAGDAEPPVSVDEMRLKEVWAGEAILLRAERGQAEADPPFTLRWLFGMMMIHIT
jgi:ATP-binding cassette subfamily B protein